MDPQRYQRLARCLAFMLLLGVIFTSGETLPVTAKPGGKRFKTVTRTFNGAAIAIPEEGAADPYPAAIDVAGFRKGKIQDVDLRLNDFSHTIASDVDILLVSPGGRSAIVLSDVAKGQTASNVDLTLDDQAAQALPREDELTDGAFQPLNVDEGDEFPAPAPATSENVALSAFNGSNPNGTWRLFVVDDQDGFTGGIAGGWELEITAKVKKKKNGNGKQ